MSAAFGLLVLASGAQAQQQPSISETLEFALRECPLALSNPNAFIAQFPVPGPSGERVWAVSQDKSLVELHSTWKGFPVTADWGHYGTHTLRHCSTHTSFEVGNMAQAETELQTWYAANVGTELRGGQMPVQYVYGSQVEEPVGYARYVSNEFIISSLGPTITTITMSYGSFGISVSVLHPTGEADE